MSSIVTFVSAATEAIRNRASSAESIFKGNTDKEREGVQQTHGIKRVVTPISLIHRASPPVIRSWVPTPKTDGF